MKPPLQVRDDGGGSRRRPAPAQLTAVDQLPDSFPLLPGESQWLATLMADELARILADD